MQHTNVVYLYYVYVVILMNCMCVYACSMFLFRKTIWSPSKSLKW